MLQVVLQFVLLLLAYSYIMYLIQLHYFLLYLIICSTERSFPRAIGLSYKDPDDEEDIMLLVRDGSFVTPPDGWHKEERTFLVEEDEPIEQAAAVGSSASAYNATIRKLRDGSKSLSSASATRLTSPTRSGSSGTVIHVFFVCLSFSYKCSS